MNITRFSRFINKALDSIGIDLRFHSNKTLGRYFSRDIRHLLRNRTNLHILDVGANIGQSINMFRSIFPYCQIDSFEPSPATFRSLQSFHGSTQNIRLHPLAISSAPGRLPLNQNTISEMSSLLELGSDGWGAIIDRTFVECTTIDNFIHAHHINKIDLLKTDTQGNDYRVIEGAKESIKNGSIDTILIEICFTEIYTPSPPYYMLLKLLDDYNMKLFSIYNMNIKNDHACYADALFVSESFLSKFNFHEA